MSQDEEFISPERKAELAFLAERIAAEQRKDPRDAELDEIVGSYHISSTRPGRVDVHGSYHEIGDTHHPEDRDIHDTGGDFMASIRESLHTRKRREAPAEHDEFLSEIHEPLHDKGFRPPVAPDDEELF